MNRPPTTQLQSLRLHAMETKKLQPPSIDPDCPLTEEQRRFMSSLRQCGKTEMTMRSTAMRHSNLFLGLWNRDIQESKNGKD